MSEENNNETPAEADVIPPTETVIADGWHRNIGDTFTRFENGQHRQTMTLGEVANYLNAVDMVIDSNKAAIARLETEQIDGSDPRLANFWAKAQELADNANHCEVFDNIAEALGGPRRSKEYEVNVTFMVSVPVTYTVTVEATDEDDAIEQAEESIGYMSASDFEDYASWYDADIDTYSMSSEIN